MISFSVISYNVIIGLLFLDYLERKFSFIEFTFNIIYYFSVIQIKFEKILFPMFKYIESFYKFKPFYITWVKNGKVCNQNDENYDFVIASKTDNTNCTNNLIIYKPTKNSANIDTDTVFVNNFFELSNIKFLMIEAIIEGTSKQYKIDLKTNDYNFYLVKNKFTKEFFIYYLNLYYNLNLNLNTDIWISILDHNVYKITLNFSKNNPHNSILLEKNEYKIL